MSEITITVEKDSSIYPSRPWFIVLYDPKAKCFPRGFSLNYNGYKTKKEATAEMEAIAKYDKSVRITN